MEREACGNTWDIGYEYFDIKIERCSKCESLKEVRPKIVFFGGRAPLYSYMRRAFEIAGVGSVEEFTSAEEKLHFMIAKDIKMFSESIVYFLH